MRMDSTKIEHPTLGICRGRSPSAACRGSAVHRRFRFDNDTEVLSGPTVAGPSARAHRPGNFSRYPRSRASRTKAIVVRAAYGRAPYRRLRRRGPSPCWPLTGKRGSKSRWRRRSDGYFTTFQPWLALLLLLPHTALIGAHQSRVHQLQTAPFVKEARNDLRPSARLLEAPLNQIGGA